MTGISGCRRCIMPSPATTGTGRRCGIVSRPCSCSATGSCIMSRFTIGTSQPTMRRSTDCLATSSLKLSLGCVASTGSLKYWPGAQEVMTLSDSRSRPAEFGKIWSAFDRFRATVDASTFAVMALILVSCVLRTTVAWTAARSSPAPNANELLRNLPYEISGDTGTALRTLRDLPASALADIIDAVESAAHELGNVATFSHLLNEFAEHEGSRGGTFYTPKSVAAILVRLNRHGICLDSIRSVLS